MGLIWFLLTFLVIGIVAFVMSAKHFEHSAE